MPLNPDTLVTLTADIAAAFFANHAIPVNDVPGAIASIATALNDLSAPVEAEPVKPKPAVSVRASIKPDHLVSMIDGKPYKMLKRHLGQNGYTPESYREAFDLPRDYPMVAASYAEARRALAVKIGLGRKRAAAKPARKPRGKRPD